jgi:hypothetical protein
MGGGVVSVRVEGSFQGGVRKGHNLVACRLKDARPCEPEPGGLTGLPEALPW